MRKYLFYFLLLIGPFAFSQSQTIEIRENQTSHLIFPSDILYTDIGDNDNFIVSYTNNILRVKGLKSQRRTNLTVITKDDYYYSFYVLYTENPKLNYFIRTSHSIKELSEADQTTTTKDLPIDNQGNILDPQEDTMDTQERITAPIKKKAVFTSQKDHRSTKNLPPQFVIDKDKLAQQAESLLKNKNRFDYISARHGDILLKVTGIYHSPEHCFISYQVRNRGVIPYDISYTEFGMREKRRPKKSAINETIFTPLLIANYHKIRVSPKRINTYVAVFDKIAVPQGKIFYIELVEAGRNIYLPIPYNKLPIEQIK